MCRLPSVSDVLLVYDVSAHSTSARPSGSQTIQTSLEGEKKRKEEHQGRCAEEPPASEKGHNEHEGCPADSAEEAARCSGEDK